MKKVAFQLIQCLIIIRRINSILYQKGIGKWAIFKQDISIYDTQGIQNLTFIKGTYSDVILFWRRNALPVVIIRKEFYKNAWGKWTQSNLVNTCVMADVSPDRETYVNFFKETWGYLPPK